MVSRQSTDIAVDLAADVSTEATYSTHDPGPLNMASLYWLSFITNLTQNIIYFVLLDYCSLLEVNHCLCKVNNNDV